MSDPFKFSYWVRPEQKAKRVRFREIFPGWNCLEYLLLKGVLFFLRCMPLIAAAKCSRIMGDLLFWVMAERRRIALANLARAFGNSRSEKEKQQIARASFQHLVTALMEFFRMEKTVQDGQNRFSFTGIEHLDRGFARGKGVILVISHLGSWEYLAFLPCLKKYPVSVVVKEARNPFITAWMRRLRRSTTANPIDKNKAARPMLSELRKNHVVAVLIDQWAGDEGLWLDFFGHATSTTSIPVRLARRTGAALIPAYCLRIRDGYYRIEVEPEVPIVDPDGDYEARTTQTLNDLLEKRIRACPEQWVWAHRRWKERKGQRVSRSSLNSLTVMKEALEKKRGLTHDTFMAGEAEGNFQPGKEKENDNAE